MYFSEINQNSNIGISANNLHSHLYPYSIVKISLSSYPPHPWLPHTAHNYDQSTAAPFSGHVHALYFCAELDTTEKPSNSGSRSKSGSYVWASPKWVQTIIITYSLFLVLTAGFIYTADYLYYSVFWSNFKPREYIFPSSVVSDFQFPDNICYLALQRPYLSLQVCIVIQFIWMFEWHYSAAFFFFFLLSQAIQVIAPSSPSSFLCYQGSEPPVPLYDWRIFSCKSTWHNCFLICT